MNCKSVFGAALVIAAAAFATPTWASSPEYIALADSADNLISRQRWDDAEKCIVSALRLEPGNFSNALLFSNLGVVQTHQGKMEDALESFRLGLSVSPRSSVIRTNRARTLLHMGRYDEALDDLNATLAIDSLQEWPLQMRGLLLINTDIKGAKRDLLNLARHYPKNATALTGLASIAEREGDGATALKYYDEAIRMEEDPDVRFSRILLKINMEQYSEASADIREAMARYPDTGDFYLLRGYLHKLNYRYDDAMADRKTALAKGADKNLVERLLPAKTAK